MKTPLLSWRRLVLGAVVFVVAWYAGSYPRGMGMAYIDHACGRYEIKEWGFPVPWRDECSKLLREKYGVEMDVVGGCMLFPTTEMYAEGYNSGSEALLVKRYGKDVFAECAEETRQKWKTEHPGEW